MGEAVANAVDAASAIRKLVFEERARDHGRAPRGAGGRLGGLREPAAPVRLAGPPFANDSDYADEIGREMMRWYIDRTRAHASRHPDVIFPCSIGTFSWYAMIGKELGASADGRRACEAIAANFSPVGRRGHVGPHRGDQLVPQDERRRAGRRRADRPALLRRAACAASRALRAWRALIRAFVDLGGNMLTATVTDVEELKRAMKEPEKYRHLRVRMGGWSAYFVMLGEEQQRIHISRVEHGLV